MITLPESRKILREYTSSASLLRHAESVSLVMESYANKWGEDNLLYKTTGLLHDADYERHPDEHPNIIVKLLYDRGEKEIAYAISAHYTKWGKPCLSLLDKTLVACDELTGFIIACALIRPSKLRGLKSKSVIKKLKQKSFANSVDREEINKGAELLSISLKEHIEFIIDTLAKYEKELDLAPEIDNV